jgi:hypothetical protein
MKNIIYTMLISLFILSSCQDEIDADGLTNYPPSILSFTPKTSTKIGDFDIKVVFADGIKSPLTSGTVVLKDADGNEIFSTTEALTGTMDSIVVEGVDFESSSLDYGDYTLIIKATDTDNQITESTTVFAIVDQLYPANNSAMFIAGEFNGWGAGVMELVSANTWEIKNINLGGGKFKFKNTPDWTDVDWGDSDCNGVAEISTGGGPDTDCGYTGLVNVRFNDETLKYTISSAVNFKSNLTGLYLLGSFNDFSGTTAKMNLIADNTWELAEIRLKEGEAFKFAESPNFEGSNYGDSNLDGKAEEFGPNIVLDDTYADAFYKITFNDATRQYSIAVARYPFPSDLYLVGGSTVAGWTPANSVPFKKTADGKFEMFTYLTSGGGGFKFLEVKDWAGDWGKGAEGVVVQEGESNLEVPSDGFYRVTVDFTNMSYTVQAMSWGLVGSARTGDDSGWNNDDNMTFIGGLGSYKWRITTTLFNGQFKFRANDGWAVNLGDSNGDGFLEYDGTDMAITAGDYVIELILDPVNGYTYTVTPD